MATDDQRAGAEQVARVTELLLDSLLAQPLQTLVVPELHARLGMGLLLAQLRGPLPFVGSVTAYVVRWLQGQGTLGVAIPAALIELGRELLRRPYMPDRALAVGLLSAAPIRALTRELMVGTLLDYGRKLKPGNEPAPGSKSAAPAKGGLSVLSRLASEAVRKGGAAAMAMAPGVTSAMSDELDRQMQRRATEFADGAVDDLLQRAATTLTDPLRRAEQLELKLAVLSYLLTLSGPQLAREIERMEPPAIAELVRAAGLGWLQRPSAEAELVTLLQQVREQAPGQTLRELLTDLGVLLPVRAALLHLFAQAAGPVLESGALQRALTGEKAV